MCLATLHDRARGLGLGPTYEKHWRSGFRDLFDSASAEWPATDVARKAVDLRAFESAGVSVAELVEHYRQTHARDGEGGGGGRRVLDSLPSTLRAYREAGYRARVPADLAAAIDGSGGRL